MNPVEQINRLTKTKRMVAQIDAMVLFWKGEHGKLGADPFEDAALIAAFLRTFTPRKWRTVAAAAGFDDASEKTIGLIIAEYEGRVSTAEVARKLLDSRPPLTSRERSGTR